MKTSSGFSLIEVVVATTVLVLLTVSTTTALIPVSRQNRMNQEMERGAAHVKDILEQVQGAPFNEIPELYPPGSTITIADLENGELLIEYEDPEADPLVITVRLSWESADMGAYERSFYAVRTP